MRSASCSLHDPAHGMGPRLRGDNSVYQRCRLVNLRLTASRIDLAVAGLEEVKVAAIVGLLDETVAEMTTPPLTALTFFSRELGEAAVDMLVAHLNDDALPPQQLLLRPRLHVRGSTGPVKTDTRPPDGKQRPADEMQRPPDGRTAIQP